MLGEIGAPTEALRRQRTKRDALLIRSPHHLSPQPWPLTGPHSSDPPPPLDHPTSCSNAHPHACP
eukprot:919772-Rhodomonas_salina.1